MRTMKQSKKQPIRLGNLLIAVLMLASFIIGSFPLGSTVSAAEKKCDKQFYSNNDILFYDPCSIEATCNNSGAGSDKVATLRGSNNGERIFNFWLDAGLSSQQAAGLTGSMWHEGLFNPFQQEFGKSWPNWGWGIAQFTGQPAPNHPDTGGQRAAVKEYLIKEIGADMFNQYYKAEYAIRATEANGFKPSNVPDDVNEAFLKGQLNYLLEHIKGLNPNNTRRSDYNRDFGVTVDPSLNLYDYLKTIVQAPDAAVAWTYLYEYPGDIKNTSKERGETAKKFLEMYGNGIATTCGGGLSAGGMTLEEAIAFMKTYTDNPDNKQYIGGAGAGCPGGPLSNCVSFSAYFINKYTSLTGFGPGTTPGNGSTVVANAIARNPSAQNGHSPRPYAIFSTPSGSQMCGSVKCGHTGVILGVDTERGKVIVGEAGCGSPASWDTAREYDLSQFDSDAYTYIYTEGLLKGDVK